MDDKIKDEAEVSRKWCGLCLVSYDHSLVICPRCGKKRFEDEKENKNK